MGDLVIGAFFGASEGGRGVGYSDTARSEGTARLVGGVTSNLP